MVLAKQYADADREIIDDLILTAEHSGQVEAHALDLDAVLRKLVQHALVILGGFEQRLEGNAADVKAGAAQAGLAFAVLEVVDADGLEPELRRTDRGGVAAGARADLWRRRMLLWCLPFYLVLKIQRRDAENAKGRRENKREIYSGSRCD
jgi:hypothetical protein